MVATPSITTPAVALLAEGVDRNGEISEGESETVSSPSSRRAWIEMDTATAPATTRASPSSRRAWIEIKPLHRLCLVMRVALLAEGVDRNFPAYILNWLPVQSPSSRRAWIEIFQG